MGTPNKILEAEKLVSEGEKHLQTGFFKWRADFDSAAPCFEKAAITYRNFKQLDKACQLFLRVAECHYRNDARFHAAKAKEEAGNISLQMNNIQNACKYCDQASEVYLLEGTPDTAALCLKRLAQKIEMEHPQIAVEVYEKAAGVYENEDDTRFRPAAEIWGKMARLQVKMGKLTDALKSIAKEKKLYSQVEGGDHGASKRLVLAEVMIQLHLGDPVQAEQTVYHCCEDVSGFDGSEEYQALTELVEAYNNNNQADAARVLNTPLFKYMDTEYAKLSKKLTVPGGSSNPSNESGNIEDDLDLL